MKIDMNKEVLGRMSFSYKNYALPLKAAHEIQSLLARYAVEVEDVFCSNAPNTCVFRDANIPPVSVGNLRNAFDARGVSTEVFNEWKETAVTREKDDPIIDPQDYARIRVKEE